jgi:hypothetical protein
VLSKLPKKNIFTGSHYLGWFCTLSVRIIIIISGLYQKNEASFLFLAWQACIFQKFVANAKK